MPRQLRPTPWFSMTLIACALTMTGCYATRGLGKVTGPRVQTLTVASVEQVFLHEDGRRLFLCASGTATTRGGRQRPARFGGDVLLALPGATRLDDDAWRHARVSYRKHAATDSSHLRAVCEEGPGRDSGGTWRRVPVVSAPDIDDPAALEIPDDVAEMAFDLGDGQLAFLNASGREGVPTRVRLSASGGRRDQFHPRQLLLVFSPVAVAFDIATSPFQAVYFVFDSAAK